MTRFSGCFWDERCRHSSVVHGQRGRSGSAAALDVGEGVEHEIIEVDDDIDCSDE